MRVHRENFVEIVRDLNFVVGEIRDPRAIPLRRFAENLRQLAEPDSHRRAAEPVGLLFARIQSQSRSHRVTSLSRVDSIDGEAADDVLVIYRPAVNDGLRRVAGHVHLPVPPIGRFCPSRPGFSSKLVIIACGPSAPRPVALAAARPPISYVFAGVAWNRIAVKLVRPTENRLFVAVAVRVSTALESVLSDLAGMGRAVRPVRASQAHLTLKFYGNVSDGTLPELVRALDELARSREPFDWRLRNTGVFPTSQRPSVVWAGVDDGGRCAALAEAIERFSVPLGFAPERRAFTPHVTLGRVKFRPPTSLAKLLQAAASNDYGAQRAESMILTASETGPAGAVYTPLHTAPFGRKRGRNGG
jgi:2'-5' RNA ligase